MRKLEETEETKRACSGAGRARPFSERRPPSLLLTRAAPPAADDRVDKNIARGIQKARLAKQMTQKELAHAIAEKATVVNQYESGKAIPNPAIINKLERALGTQLRERKKKKKRGGGAAR